jgi:hypothetical protein
MQGAWSITQLPPTLTRRKLKNNDLFLTNILVVDGPFVIKIITTTTIHRQQGIVNQ